MTRVKICGVTSLEVAQNAVAAGAFAIGFNFHPESPRYVEVARAREIAAELAPPIWRVGVFVDRDRETIARVAEEAGLNALQFHGDEPAELCRGWSIPVIKAVRVRTRADIERLAEFPVELILVDAYVEGTRGGAGVRFDWSLLDGVDRKRLILAGGLTPENVAEAVRTVRPWGVDVASGVEAGPGLKDPEKVRRFIRNAQTA